MGFIKTYSYGTKQGEYWKIIGNHSNTMYSATVVRIALYKDKSERDRDETSYIKVLPISIPGFDHTRKTAYEALKNRPEFTDAVDVFEE